VVQAVNPGSSGKESGDRKYRIVVQVVHQNKWIKWEVQEIQELVVQWFIRKYRS
jgi:hypothetical protein